MSSNYDWSQEEQLLEEVCYHRLHKQSFSPIIDRLFSMEFSFVQRSLRFTWALKNF